jgi:hypothetical protein
MHLGVELNFRLKKSLLDQLKRQMECLTQEMHILVVICYPKLFEK